MSAEAEAQIQPHKKYSRTETRWKEDYGGKKDISEKNLEALNDVFAEDKKKKKKREREEGTEWEEPLDSRSPGYEIYGGA